MRKPKIAASRVGMTMLTFVMLLSAAACGGEAGRGPGVDESRSWLQPDGPLRGLVMAKRVTGKQTIDDPRFAFTADDKEAVAVVTLGSDTSEGATLTMAWYRLAGVDGREHLFSHEIQVGPGGMAYSQGVAPGGLAPGIYEVVATLGERQVRVLWVVRRAADGAAASTSVVNSTVPVTVFAASFAQTPAAEPEPWEVPGPGDYAYNSYNRGGPEAPPAPNQSPGPCTVNSVYPGFDPMSYATANVNFAGACSSMTLAAMASGPPLTVASTSDIDPNRPSTVLHGEAELCNLPGGSDFPGTIVNWTATGSDGASGSAAFKVPDYGELIEAIIQSDPEGPRRIESGQTIQLRGMAMVMPPALGIKELSILAGDELLQKVGNASGSSEPQSCDPGRFVAVNRTHYTVPANPPPVIQICSEAVGFDGRKSRACTEFFTGEVWEGSLAVKGTYAGTATCTSRWQGTVRFVVSDDGSIQGKGTISNPGEYLCSVPAPQPPAYTTEFTVGGHTTETGFQIEFGGVIKNYTEGLGLPPSQIEVSRSDNRASASSANTYPGGDASATIEHTWTLECKSCGE